MDDPLLEARTKLLEARELLRLAPHKDQVTAIIVRLDKCAEKIKRAARRAKRKEERT